VLKLIPINSLALSCILYSLTVVALLYLQTTASLLLHAYKVVLIHNQPTEEMLPQHLQMSKVI
jgi:hypothetical protein